MVYLGPFVVLPDTVLNLLAGYSIALSGGFSARSGSDFSAQIESCAPPARLANREGGGDPQPAYKAPFPIPAAAGAAGAAGMGQNVPNPFSGGTQIPVHLPEGAEDARLLLRDLNGTVVQVVELPGRGDIYVELSPSDGLAKGMYFYSLTVDGAVVAKRRMVLLK